MDYNKETESIRYGKLLAKARLGDLTEAEEAEFDAWLAANDHRALHESLQNEPILAEELARFDRYEALSVFAVFQKKRDALSQKPRMLKRWLPYAAALLLVSSVVAYLMLDGRKPTTEQLAGTEIQPGSNRATLTLADGRTIVLSADHEGIVIQDGVNYLDGSAVFSEPANAQTHILTLSTPYGGTYSATLPDGSRVWLNAATTISYPSRFSGNERTVEISGEAYFSVAKDVAKPFKVRSNGQTIDVLGTEFNVSAYRDDTETKTTLVEGEVQVVNLTSNIVNKLQPGEQSVTQGASTETYEIDVAPYIAWKSGKFLFKNTPFPDMIAQVARWYDVEVVYEGKVPSATFSGDMKRSVSLVTVLDMLKISSIPFRIEGKKLIIE